MKLTVLGGSAAGPNPGQGCSGYLIESGPTRVVVDLGPGTLPELRKHANFRELDAVVISHLHLDHYLDLLTLRFALAYNPIPALRPLSLWLPPGGLDLLDRLAFALAGAGQSDQYFSVFAAQEYPPDEGLDVGDLRFQFAPTVHGVPCWSMRISNGTHGDLFYTADTGPSANLSPFAARCHVLIAEGTQAGESGQSLAERGHLTPREAGELARQASVRLLVLTHLWAENDPFVALREARQAFGGPVELATPGLEVCWTDFD